MEKYGRIWRQVSEGNLDEEYQMLLIIDGDTVWISQDACTLVLVSEHIVYVTEVY